MSNAAAGGDPPDTVRRLALTLEYDGAGYAGFQIQANEITIQGAVEEALRKFLGQHIRIRGASRTDSGAHAFGQVIDFTTDRKYEADIFVRALNYYLPGDIKVIRAMEVEPGFDSRRSAASRVYQYRLLNRSLPSPLMRHYYHWVREPLKIEDMHRAAQDLLGIHDFRPLAPGHPIDRSAVRQVFRWEVAPGLEFPDTVSITCEANGFMLHQIRRTNAALVQIGKGIWPGNALKIILGEAAEPIGSLSAESLGSLPARGLYLMEVKYPDCRLQVKDDYETN